MAAKRSSFPKFDDGDLVVSLPEGHFYQLHAGVFRRASNFFSQILAENMGAVLSSKAKKEGITIRFRLDLVGVSSGNAHLIARQVNHMGRSEVVGILPDIENGKVPNKVYQHYDNVFRSFYNEPLRVDTDNLVTALHDCIGLVDVAESYDCIGAVRESVEISLLRQGQVLFKSISQKPVAWANFACRIQSPTIFKDSLIHLVGMWKMLKEDELANLGSDISKVCQRKYEEFQLEKEAIELRILGHYSLSIQKAEADNPGRSNYANDVYSWMALALFRQWFAQNIVQGQNLLAKDGGYAFYYLLYKGGPYYLDHKQCEGFHLYFPMSKKGMTVLENHLAQYKAEIPAFVAPLMANRSQLEFMESTRPDHLVCLEVEPEDYPWNASSEGSINSVKTD